MQYGVNPVWLDTLLDLIAGRLVPAVGSADRVLESLAPDADHCQNPPADSFILIRPVRFPANQPIFAGAGRFAAALDGTVRVACVARYAGDQEMRSAKVLKDKTRGVLAFVRKALDLLWGWDVPTAAGATTSYLREPMRLVEFSLDPKPVRDGSPWVVCPSFWELKFNLNVSPTVPT